MRGWSPRSPARSRSVLSFATLPAIATALARMRASAASGPAAFTAVTCVFGVGQIVGPFTGGALADRAGPAAVAWLAAAYYAAGAAFALADGVVQRRRGALRARRLP